MGHYGSDCRNYNTYRQRVHQLKANNRCTKCIKEGHNYEDCEKEVKCATCKSLKHHTVLCPKNLGQKQVSFQSDDTDEDEHRQSRAKIEPKETAAEKRVPYRRPSNNVVSPVIQALRTSKAADQKTFDIVEEILRSAVDVKSDESHETESSDADDEDDEFKTSNKTILPYVQAELAVPNLPSKTVMLFLDSGSASTFIDQKLADKYNLPISYRKNITFNAFGEKHLEPAIYNAYEFNLLKNDGTQMQIIAYGVERLTSITVAFPNLEDKDLQSEVMEYDYTTFGQTY